MDKEPKPKRKFAFRWRGRRWYDPNWNTTIFAIIVIVYLLMVLDSVDPSKFFKK
jgi:hypothetical protein